VINRSNTKKGTGVGYVTCGTVAHARWTTLPYPTIKTKRTTGAYLKVSGGL